MSLLDYSQTKQPVFEIDLDIAPYDRWQEVDRKERARLGRFLADIKKMAKQQANAWLQQFPKPKQPFIRCLLRGSIKVTGPLAIFVARIFGEEYQEEIQGLAHASRHNLSTLFLANLMYDISVGIAAMPTACSSFSTTLDESPVLVRTMDWTLPRSTDKYTYITRFWKRSNSYINVAPLGCVSVLSAIRTGAWAVTLNQAPPNGLPCIFKWSAMHRLRTACDASLSYASLVRRIRPACLRPGAVKAG